MTPGELLSLRDQTPCRGGTWEGEPSLNEWGFWEIPFRTSKADEVLIAFVRDRVITSERVEQEIVLDLRRAISLASRKGDQ
jgi:hypothetical protein